ncbi:unnamed protein product, partial [Allacma fusca]
HFLIYINELLKLPLRGIASAFADDTVLIVSADSEDELISALNSDLQRISLWFSQHGLRVNAAKSELVVFGFQNRYVRDLRGKVFLHERECGALCSCPALVQVEKHRYLGVWVDQCLTWREHCLVLRAKLSKIVYLIRYLSGLVSGVHLRRFYVAVFEGTLRFGIAVWGGGAATCWIRPLLMLQKRAARLVAGERWDAPSQPVFRSLGIFTHVEKTYRGQW